MFYIVIAKSEAMWQSIFAFILNYFKEKK